MSNNIVGILLAAGQSTRFGSNKLLHILPENNKSIASQAAVNLLQVLPNSIAVINDNENLKIQLAATGIRVVENRHATLGLSSSIVCGIQHSANADGWLIALADMPYISTDIIKQVVYALQQGKTIVAPQYKNQRGHPIGFSNRFATALLNLKGDIGAKTIIQNHLTELYTFESSSDAIIRDIDKPEDLYPS